MTAKSKPTAQAPARNIVRRWITIAFAAQAVLMPVAALVVAATVHDVADSMTQVAAIFTADLGVSGWVIREYFRAGHNENMVDE